MAEGEITEATSESHRAEMESLAKLFHSDVSELGQFTAIGQRALPHTYGTLLSHRAHMTVTLEAFHESLVDVYTLSELPGGTSYARRSLLTRQSDDAVVQYGIMRIDLTRLSDEVRSEIESRTIPLGRILIRNNLLREVELLALWQIDVGETLSHLLGKEKGDIVYGRSAVIHLADQPAVELLEIVTDNPVRVFP